MSHYTGHGILGRQPLFAERGIRTRGVFVQGLLTNITSLLLLQVSSLVYH